MTPQARCHPGATAVRSVVRRRVLRAPIASRALSGKSPRARCASSADVGAGSAWDARRTMNDDVSLGTVLLAAADRHRGIAMRVPCATGFDETSFGALGAAAREIAAGLIDLGVRPGDRVAILGSTRPEWTLADCGALCAGATVVPVYHTNSPEECRYVLAHSEATVLICEDGDQLQKIERSELPDLEHV